MANERPNVVLMVADDHGLDIGKRFSRKVCEK